MDNVVLGRFGCMQKSKETRKLEKHNDNTFLKAGIRTSWLP
jgi:hypothetical protein